jgi:nucleoside 2-deoxyribosyltransferase
MSYIYIAGPLFNTHERWYLERIAEVLEGAGHRTFLPHRDAGVIGEFTPQERLRVFETDLNALDTCDLCVALLTGADHDSGTSAEIGYLSAKGITCIGVSDDVRRLNNMIWGFCNHGQNVVRRIEDVLPLVEKILNRQGA